MNVSQALKIISIDYNHLELIGSFANKEMQFYSDIDCQEEVKHMTSKKFISHLKAIVREVNNTPDIYFSDFKMGEYRHKSVHFKQDEVLKGEVDFPLKKEKISMEELLLTKSIIKLDVIAFIKKQKRFVDITVNFYFHNEGISTTPDRNLELREIFKSEYFKNIDGGNYMKAVKRLYKLAELTRHVGIAKRIVEFLNSRSGLISLVSSTVTTLANVIKIKNFDSWKEYSIEIDELVSYSHKLGFRGASVIIKHLSTETQVDHIHESLIKISGYFENYANQNAEKFLGTISRLGEFLITV